MEITFPLTPGGNLNSQSIPFLAKSAIIDNPTGTWWYVKESGYYVAPYTLRNVLPLPGSQVVTILQQDPPGQVSVNIPSQLGEVTFSEVPQLVPSGGISLGVGGSLPIVQIWTVGYIVDAPHNGVALTLLAILQAAVSASLTDQNIKAVAFQADPANAGVILIGGSGFPPFTSIALPAWKLSAGDAISFMISSLSIPTIQFATVGDRINILVLH